MTRSRLTARFQTDAPTLSFVFFNSCCLFCLVFARCRRVRTTPGPRNCITPTSRHAPSLRSRACPTAHSLFSTLLTRSVCTALAPSMHVCGTGVLFWSPSTYILQTLGVKFSSDASDLLQCCCEIFLGRLEDIQWIMVLCTVCVTDSAKHSKSEVLLRSGECGMLWYFFPHMVFNFHCDVAD